MTERYDNRTIALHWGVAVLVVFMWCGAHAIDWFPKGALRVDARSAHILAGGGLTAVTGYRVFWRTARGVRIAEPSSALATGAQVVHVMLYGLLFAALGLGIANAWVRGDSLFGWARIPAYGGYDAAARHALSEQIVGWHGLAANGILILAACHAMAALYHRFVLHDGVLGRMMPDRNATRER